MQRRCAHSIPGVNTGALIEQSFHLRHIAGFHRAIEIRIHVGGE